MLENVDSCFGGRGSRQKTNFLILIFLIITLSPLSSCKNTPRAVVGKKKKKAAAAGYHQWTLIVCVVPSHKEAVHLFVWSSYCAPRDPCENVMVASLWIRCQCWGSRKGGEGGTRWMKCVFGECRQQRSVVGHNGFQHYRRTILCIVVLLSVKN